MNIVFSKEVESVLKYKRFVVVLELIIIIYGMFYFKNVEMVFNVENIICK